MKKIRAFRIMVVVLSVWIGVWAGSDSHAADTLIVNGGFEKNADETGSIPGWRLSSGDGCLINRHEDKTAYLTLVNAAQTGSAFCQQSLTLSSDYKQLRFSLRARVRQIIPGSAETWHNCRLAVSFQKPGQTTIHVAPFVWKEPDPEWKEYTKTVDIPEGAKLASIALAIFSAVGEADFDDVRVEAVSKDGSIVSALSGNRNELHGMASVVLPVEGASPDGVSWEWGREPVEAESETRGTICLNGLWRFAPGTEVDTPERWGVIRVPGSWRPFKIMPGVQQVGQGWKKDWQKSPSGWYERELLVPAAWTGRKILLDFKRVATDALVYLDGKPAGKLSWPDGEIDITPLCVYGKTMRLSLLVVAQAESKEITTYMGDAPEQVIKNSAQINNRGIIGDAFLRSRPMTASIDSCQILSSTRKNRLTVSCTMQAVAECDASVSAKIYNDAGGLEKVFTANARIGQDGVFSVGWDWSDPVLWTTDQPNLYRMVLTVEAAEGQVKDQIEKTFGFREFWIEGRDFYLNGAPIRLRPALCSPDDRCGSRYLNEVGLKGLKASGFNFVEIWPVDRNRRATAAWESNADFDYICAEEADKVGMLLAMPAVDAGDSIRNLGNERVMEFWSALTRKRLSGLWNHPSVVIWCFAANRFNLGQDQNPAMLGCRGALKGVGEHWLRTVRSGFMAVDKLHEIDPTRPVFTHAGDFVGDIYTTNHYLCLTPLQEREEWLSAWAEKGDMPFLVVEFGTPFYATFMRGRNGYGNAQKSEPLATEYVATYFGEKAYQLEDQEYRDYLRRDFIKDQQYGPHHTYKPLSSCLTPTLEAIQELFNRNTFRSWRTAGITGGMIPWGMHGWDSTCFDGQVEKNRVGWKPGERGTYLTEYPRNLAYAFQSAGVTLNRGAQAVVENNSETLAWIAGAGESFTDKAHLFSPGEKVAKQIALLNDTAHPQLYEWQVLVSTIDGLLYRTKKTGTIAAGQTLLEEFSFVLPREFAEKRTAVTIQLTANIGTHSHKDAFAIEILKASGIVKKDDLFVYDPAAETTAMLRASGWRVRTWQDEAGLVVIGRNVLADDPALLARVERHVENGGRAVIMEQKPEWLSEQMGFRVAKHMARRVFPLSGAAGLWEEMDAELLRDWRGSSSLIPPTNPDVKSVIELTRAPKYGWRWGGRGAVSSCAIEKPHYSGWTPLLECEFDLAYTPLMQLNYGSGLLVFCGLDLEDHAADDPAARWALERVIAGAMETPVIPRCKTAFLGNEQDESLLRQAGVVYEKTDSLREGDGLLIVSADELSQIKGIDEFVSNGAQVFVLASRSDGKIAGGITLKKDEHCAGSLSVPQWPVCKGLSASDLRWRTNSLAYRIDGGCETGVEGLLGRRQVGKGAIYFCQIDPDLLQADEKTYMRFTRWRQTRAISQLLANLGASFEADNLFFHPERAGKGESLSLVGEWKAMLTTPLEPLADGKHKDNGISEKAKSLVLVDSPEDGFQNVTLPSAWENYGEGWEAADGEAVFRKTVTIPAAWAGKKLVLSLGPVDDFDMTFFNGVKVGSVDVNTPQYWSKPRVYEIPAALVKEGKAVIAVRVFDHWGSGGMYGLSEMFSLSPAEEKAEDKAGSYYHADYRTDFYLGDDPYRYYRW